MPKAVTLYRWDDESAPQLTSGTYSEIIGVIEACLVTGYGSKQPLGWTKLFTEATACCFQNKGAGCVVFSSNSGANDNKGVYLQGAQSATSSTNLVRAGWKQSIKVHTGHNVNWMVLGTDTAVYVIFGYIAAYAIQTPKYFVSCFFGDLSNGISQDAGKFVALSSFMDEDFSLETVTTIGTRTGRNLDFLNDIDGNSKKGVKIFDSDAANSFSLYVPEGPHLPVNTTSANSLGSISSNSLVAITMIFKNYETSKDRAGEWVVTSSLSPACRGTLPGMYNTLCAHPNDVIWPAFVNYGGQQHLVLRVTQIARASKLVINTEMWDD
ncbi:hypothetical protein [Pseudoalteromonas luteoviolacea]|uniref:hypothetical protein n=1 Tax=Pseudoalteromonas luteoviolacea TaxID=43657 RepID=UPI001B3588FC|nr:hypothetical protein [Pseudoalteromonas luteoviolacea]MBQ4836036.1 hypothetical protein [Pseudoalteromonas luteoviolacea]